MIECLFNGEWVEYTSANLKVYNIWLAGVTSGFDYSFSTINSNTTTKSCSYKDNGFIIYSRCTRYSGVYTNFRLSKVLNLGKYSRLCITYTTSDAKPSDIKFGLCTESSSYTYLDNYTNTLTNVVNATNGVSTIDISNLDDQDIYFIGRMFTGNVGEQNNGSIAFTLCINSIIAYK